MSSLDLMRMFRDLPSPYMVLGTDLTFIDMNAKYLDVTQRTREDLIGRYVFDAFPETGERLAKFRSAFERALAGEANSLVREVFSIERPGDCGGTAQETYWTCWHMPVFSTDGVICGMLQKADDVTAEVTAANMRDVIASEFDHRVRNILATVSSVARATAQSAPSIDGFLEALDGRIEALACTHSILSQGGTVDTELRDLVESQLAPYHEAGSEPILDGPSLRLTRRQAQGLGMALHELATNAAKYGAFSNPEGQLHVTWFLDENARACTILWEESGLEGLAAPRRSGFGSKILTRALPMELGGKVDCRYCSTGLRFSLTFPLGHG